MTLKTIDLTPHIGTQILADKAALLDGSLAGEIRTLLEQRGVLLFRGFDMTDEEQIRFGNSLGKPRHEHGTDITMVSSDKNKSPIFAEYTEGTFMFHFDDTYMEYPALASILRCKVAAPQGGQTEFANTYAIYDDLPEQDQRWLDTLHGEHSQECIQRKAFPDPSEWQLSLWGEGALPAKTHPLVWLHRTGRKSLLLGETMKGIVELSAAESAALVKRLRELADRREYIYQHDWRVGDVLIWDNTGTVHRVVPFDLDSGRELYRVKLAGEEPIRAVTEAAAL